MDFRKEFPYSTGGSTGINSQFLSKNAFVQLKAVMNDKRTRVLQHPAGMIDFGSHNQYQSR